MFFISATTAALASGGMPSHQGRAMPFAGQDDAFALALDVRDGDRHRRQERAAVGMRGGIEDPLPGGALGESRSRSSAPIRAASPIPRRASRRPARVRAPSTCSISPRRAGSRPIDDEAVADLVAVVADADAVRRHKPGGTALATRVATDVLVAANTSNWGAYGIVAALAAILSRPEIMHGPDDEARTSSRASTTSTVRCWNPPPSSASSTATIGTASAITPRIRSWSPTKASRTGPSAARAS
jgi:hypothetical protein